MAEESKKKKNELEELSIGTLLFILSLGAFVGFMIGIFIGETAQDNGTKWEQEEKLIIKYDDKFYKLELLEFKPVEKKKEK